MLISILNAYRSDVPMFLFFPSSFASSNSTHQTGQPGYRWGLPLDRPLTAHDANPLNRDSGFVLALGALFFASRRRKKEMRNENEFSISSLANLFFSSQVKNGRDLEQGRLFSNTLTPTFSPRSNPSSSLSIQFERDKKLNEILIRPDFEASFCFDFIHLS